MTTPRPLGLCATAALLGSVAVGLLTTSAGATGVVPKSTVQTQAAKILAKETGQKPPKVTCTGGLKAKVGATVHCTVVPHGSTLKYPALVTIRSIHGSTANFHVQVGQAAGQANKAKFCADNTTLLTAVSAATTPAAFISALEANESTIIDFQSTAPSKIVDQAGALVQAARAAINSGNPAAFGTKAAVAAGNAVDAFCGQGSNGQSTAATTPVPPAGVPVSPSL
jgi:hypothetical protein